MDSLSPFYFLIRIDVICFVMYVNVLKVSITFSQRSKLPCMLLEFVGQMYITGRKEGLETLFSRHQWLLVMNPVVRCLLLVKELQTWKLVSYNIISITYWKEDFFCWYFTFALVFVCHCRSSTKSLCCLFPFHFSYTVKTLFNGHLGDRRKWLLRRAFKQKSMYGYFVLWDKKVTVVERWLLVKVRLYNCFKGLS